MADLLHAHDKSKSLDLELSKAYKESFDTLLQRKHNIILENIISVNSETPPCFFTLICCAKVKQESEQSCFEPRSHFIQNHESIQLDSVLITPLTGLKFVFETAT